MDVHFDEIGYWSEVKLDIIKEYAKAYSTILAAQRRDKYPKMKHIYIDGFAGSGQNISRATKEFILGSPLNALQIEPPFLEYHLVDLNTGKANVLKETIGERVNKDVFVYQDDCNKVLFEEILPKVRYEDYVRALCILDPYGLHLDWKVIEMAGRSNQSICF